MTRRASQAAAVLGRRGRAVNSAAQQDAARANGAKGGRPVETRTLPSGAVVHADAEPWPYVDGDRMVTARTPAAAKWLRRNGWRCVWVRTPEQ